MAQIAAKHIGPITREAGGRLVHVGLGGGAPPVKYRLLIVHRLSIHRSIAYQGSHGFTEASK